MARGWGRSEEDLGAEKEHAREARRAPDSGARRDARRRTEAHSLELSLARIEDQLSKTSNEARRRALESARQELQTRLDVIRSPPE
ncbi:MAG: hypothetical protein ABJC07_00675 [Acidobacteriota bacterium]